jgi:hypothetical protein
MLAPERQAVLHQHQRRAERAVRGVHRIVGQVRSADVLGAEVKAARVHADHTGRRALALRAQQQPVARAGRVVEVAGLQLGLRIGGRVRADGQIGEPK